MIFHSSYGLHHCCLDGFTLFMDGHSKMSYFFLIPLTQIGSDRGWILNLWFWVTQVIQFLLIQQIESSLWKWNCIWSGRSTTSADFENLTKWIQFIAPRRNGKAIANCCNIPCKWNVEVLSTSCWNVVRRQMDACFP